MTLISIHIIHASVICDKTIVQAQLFIETANLILLFYCNSKSLAAFEYIFNF